MNESEKFSARLKRWRARVDLSQPKAAKLLKIGRTYYSELENGREPGKFLKMKFDAIERAGVDYINRSLQSLESAEPDRRQLAEMLDRHYSAQNPVVEGMTGDTVQDPAGEYGMMKKIIKIAEEGTPQQKALVNDFLDSVCKQLGIAKRAPGNSVEQKG